MREVFKSLDVDATGELGAAEVVRAMRRLGIGATEADGAKMVRLLDSNRDGAVTFSEFKQYTSLLPAAQLREEGDEGGAPCSVRSGAVRLAV